MTKAPRRIASTLLLAALQETIEETEGSLLFCAPRLPKAVTNILEAPVSEEGSGKDLESISSINQIPPDLTQI